MMERTRWLAVLVVVDDGTSGFARPDEVTLDDLEHELLPKLGPTAFLLARRLVRHADRFEPVVEAESIADELGVKLDRLWRAVQRLERFGHASTRRTDAITAVYLTTVWRAR